MPQLQLIFGHCSKAGRKTENQDAFGLSIPKASEMTHKGAVAVVADGVSSCEDGRLASESCVQGFLSDYYATPDSWSVRQSVEKVLLALNRWLYSQGSRPGSLATTLSAAIFKSHTAHLFHVGDSRIYRLRGGKLERLTQDHSWGSGGRQLLSRAIGIDLHLRIDYRTVPLEEGDLFLLTTDGVHGFLRDEQLKALIGEDLQRSAERIVQAAFEAGSPDNLTALLLRIERLPEADPHEYYRQLTELPFPPLLEPGMRLDDYEILRELVASKRVHIYLARSRSTGRKLVLKTPSPNYQDDPLYIDLFSHEEWVGLRLDNPHVMKVFRPKRRSCLYLVCEFIEGETLRQWMDRKPRRSLQEVREIVAQIAKGLYAFHRLEMLHQDLKPENLMITPEGLVKIIDFGSVRIAGLEEITSPLERIELLGTKHYAAPEYFLGHRGTPRSDLFSLAVVTYELLTGKLPYGERYGEGSLLRLKYQSARRWNREIPIWVDKALEKALALDPERRYAQVSEFIYDLEHPNPHFLSGEQPPLIERDPVAFWRGLALLALLGDIILLLLLLGGRP